MSAPVVQWQTVASDPEGPSKFYRQLFGWTISTDNMLGYRAVSTGNAGTPGGIWPSPRGGPTFLQLYVAVDDVQAQVDEATALGARWSCLSRRFRTGTPWRFWPTRSGCPSA